MLLDVKRCWRYVPGPIPNVVVSKGTGYGVLSDHGSVTTTTQRTAGVPVEYQVVVSATILVYDKAESDDL